MSTKNRSSRRKHQIINKKLIKSEAQIGGTIFGDIPKGHRREFYCMDKHSWVWREEWTDKKGIRHFKNVRYNVRPNKLIKIENGIYSVVGPNEAKRFFKATELYFEKISKELYGFES